MAAFVATDGGRVGAITAAAPAAPTAAMPTSDGRAGGGKPGAGDTGRAAAATAGETVWAWPCGSVIVTRLVVLLITTVLWMLL
jgi:hypothetical protein